MGPQPSPPNIAMLESLPHHDCLVLAADDTAPREPRRRIGKLLPEWRLPQFEIVTSLIVSELLTNSVTATASVRWPREPPPVLLWLRAGTGIVAVLAWDATGTPPCPRTAADDDESGRGLAIVGALSAGSGFYYSPQYAGKVTWAVIDTP
jgi:hypothetical protein